MMLFLKGGIDGKSENYTDICSRFHPAAISCKQSCL